MVTSILVLLVMNTILTIPWNQTVLRQSTPRFGKGTYYKVANNDLAVQVINVDYCGANSPNVPANLTEEIDTTDLYDPTTNPNGISSNFNFFSGRFDPSTDPLIGVFVSKWQAGRLDPNTRSFITKVSENNDGSIEALAFAGFGPSMDLSLKDVIAGFICNWAEPGNTKMIHPLAQKQPMTFDQSLGFFIPDPAQDTNISYPITNSCSYDGTGSFIQDVNLDGLLNGLDNDPTAVFDNDLFSLDKTGGNQVTDTNGNNLPDAIEDFGIEIPPIVSEFDTL